MYKENPLTQVYVTDDNNISDTSNNTKDKDGRLEREAKNNKYLQIIIEKYKKKSGIVRAGK